MPEYIQKQCPDCGEWRKVRRRSQPKRCQRCHNKRIAPLGHAATVAIYGPKFPLPHIRQYRLDNPSSLEIMVMNALNELGYAYERELLITDRAGRCYLVDFVCAIGGGFVAIEVNGEYVHGFHAERDMLKVQALQRQQYKVVTLDESTIKQTQDLPQVLGEMILMAI